VSDGAAFAPFVAVGPPFNVNLCTFLLSADSRRSQSLKRAATSSIFHSNQSNQDPFLTDTILF
jgi:hypothetical protein